MLNNNTTNATIPSPSPSETRVILNSIFISIVMLATIIGNSLVIFCVYYYPRLRSQTNCLIVSLAVADWLIGTLSLPLRLAQTVEFSQWPFNFRTCQFWIWVDMLCSAASILNLMGISIERLIAVVDPLKYEKRMSKRRVCLMIGLIWIFALISASLSLAKWKGPVIIIGPECSIMSKEYITFVSTAAFFVPLAVVLVNYSIIFRVAVRHARRLHKETRSLATNYCAESTAPDANQNLDIPKNKKRKSFLRPSFFSARKDYNQRSATFSLVKQLKATKTLAVVLGVFFICWFPFFVIYITFQYCSHTCFEPPQISIGARDAIVTIFVNVLPVANSAANPIIYSCFNAEFRKAFKKILAKRFNRKQSLDNGNTSFTAVPSNAAHKEFEHSSA